MGDFDDYAHEQLAQLLAGADPEQLTTRADVLLAMARALNGADKEIFVRMSQVEWQGEGAEAFRAWGRHLVRESTVLAGYARTVGNALQDAGQALYEAKSAMPPVPGAAASEVGTAVSAGADELLRQEAIHVVERLSSHYGTAANDMAAAQEPRFQPLNGIEMPVEEDVPIGSARDSVSVGAQPGPRGTPAGVGSPGGYPPDANSETSTAPHVGHPDDGERGPGMTVPVPQPGVADGRVGTSLDSIAPVAERPLPVGESGVPSGMEGRGLAGGQGGDAPVRVLPHSPAGQLSQRSVQPRPTMPGVPQPLGGGRVPSGGGVGSPGARPLVLPAQDAYSAGRPLGMGPTAPAGSGGQGPLVGRPPMQAGAGALANGAPSRGQAPSAIIGGVRRPPASASRSLPPSAAIGAQTSFAYRDPVTGLVHGPGGVPVMKRPGEPRNRPTPDSERTRAPEHGDGRGRSAWRG